MSLSVTISGSSVSIKDKSLTITDALNQRSQCTFVVEDASGTNHYQFGQPVVVSDSTNGVLFAGFVNQSDEQKLVPNPNAEIKITCMDTHYLADKRRVTKDYQNMAAGDIATDLLSSYLAAEGVTAGYAYKRTSTQTEWGAGGLTGVTNALNVGDGDLELSPIGSTVTKTETTTSDFAAGTLTNVDAQSNQLNLHASNALKFTATNVGNLGNTYVYWMIWSGSQSIASGDSFQYDVWISSTSPLIQAGVDFVCTDGTTARDFNSQAIQDQFHIGLHPGSDLKGMADDQWYTRGFDLTAMAGKTISFVTIAFEGDSGGDYQAYFKNIKLLDTLGSLKATFYDGGAHPYTPNAVTLSANQIVSDNGYTALSVSNVTVYEKTGSRVSPAISIDAAKIPATSLVSWTSLIPAGVTPPTPATGQTAPVVPTGTALTIYTSIDNKATWQAASFKQAIPDLLPGCNIASRNLYTKAVLAITGTTPELSPILADLTTTITSSWSSTKHDAIATYATSTDFGTGTYSNTRYDTAIGTPALDLTSYCENYDQGFLAHTLFGSSSPAQKAVRKQWQVSTGNATDARSRVDQTPDTWQNFTLQVSVTIQASGNYGAGVVYRTTGWQNANDTYAYTAMLNQNPHGTGVSYIQLGRGTNTGGGGGAYTNISEVALPFVLASGSTYALTVIANGSNHKVYVDGVLYLNATDATYAAAGQIALRVYSNNGSAATATFDDYGVSNALTGTWVSPTINIGSVIVNNVGNSVIAWDADAPASGCSLLVEVNPDGAGWSAATNGGQIPGVTIGSLGPGNIQVRFTFTIATANQAESLTVRGLTVWVTNQTSASGNRVSNSLSLANVGRAGSALLSANSIIPNVNTTLGLDISPDGVTWTTLTNAATAQYSTPLPSSFIYAQPDPWLDNFGGSAATAANGVTIGLNPGTGNPGSPYAFWTQLLADMQALGMTWLRFQLSWDSIELTQGNYSWTVLDDAVSHCNAAGIKIWYTIRGAPSWALDPANGGQLTCSDGWYIMSPSMAAGFATVLLQRYYPGSPHGWLDGLGFNEDFNIHATSTSDTLTLNQTLTSGTPYTSFSINAAGAAPMAGTVLYFSAYGSATRAVIATGHNVHTGDTTVTCNSFTPSTTYTAGTSIKLAYVPATSSVYDLYDPGSGGRTTANPKSQASRNPVYAAAVFNAVAPAIRALNTTILIGMPCTWWLQPINAPTFPGSPVSNMTAFVTALLTACAAHIDAKTIMDGHFYTNGVDPTVGNGQTSTIAQWVADFQNAANANGFPNLPLVCSEFGWQANQSATSSTSVAGAGSRTITLNVTRGAANGITCLVDTVGSGVQETVTITAKTSTSITAVFANAHTAPFPVVINLDCAPTGADGQDERFNEALTAIAPGGARGNMAFPFTLDETQSLSSGSTSSLVLWNGSGYSQQPAYSVLLAYNMALNPDFSAYSQTNLTGGGAATWSWDATNNRLLGTQTTGVQGVLQYTGFSRADMFVEAAVNSSDSGGLVARMVDASNLYFVTLADTSASINPNTILLKKSVAGTITTLATYTLPTAWIRGDWHIFRLDAEGTALSVSLDNTQVISASDSSITAAGKAGIMAGQSTGDKIQVYYLRIQPYGDTVSSLSLYSRQRLSSADPTVTPQLTDMTLSVHDPNIGVGATVSTTAWSGVGSQMFQVSQALDDLAKQSTSPAQFVWHIGTSSPPRLYFHQQQAVAAPFYLYSGGSGAANGSGGNILAVSPPVVSRPDMLYRNRQTIDGGFDTTTLIHEQRKGDGVTQAWPMTWPLASVPTVTLTAPAINLAGQPETVGVQGVDTGKDFYWQSGNNVISQDVSETPPASTDTLDFYYYGQIPVRVTRDNTNGTGTYAGTVGQTQLAAIDGTSGIVEDYEQVPGLNKAQATAIADARLVQYGKLGLSWQFMTTQFGLAPGQLAFARVAEHGITNQPFLISQVQTTAQGAAVAGGILYEYTVQLTSGPVLGSYEVFFGKAFMGSVA